MEKEKLKTQLQGHNVVPLIFQNKLLLSDFLLICTFLEVKFLPKNIIKALDRIILTDFPIQL